MTAAHDLAVTLDEAAAFIGRFVVLSDAQRTAATLWAAHSHALDAAEATPYLNVHSAEPESGKTRLLEVLELVVARPWLTGRVTAAVLPRRIEKEQPTLLLDESDAAFGGDREYAETLRGVLNAGYRRGGSVSVCVGQGANISYATLSSFCPKAIAGLGRLPDTVASRAIPVRLKRRAPSEQIERFRRRDALEAAEPIAVNLAMLAEQHIDLLSYARPLIPEGLGDRAADVWEPLLAIAELAGDAWTERARTAAVELATGQEAEDRSAGVRLLADTRAVFETVGDDRLSSAALVSRLNELPEAPWAEWSKGRGLTQNALAKLLRGYEIRSRTVRFSDETTARGYRLEQFADAFARYLKPRSDTSDTTRINKPKTADSEVTQDSACVTSENGANPHEQGDVSPCHFETGDEAEQAEIERLERLFGEASS